jgi:glutamate--cysteine ligase
MTFTVTPVGRPVVRELTTSGAAALHIAGNTLADGPVRRVGLELEAHCIDLTNPHRRPGWQRITETIAGVPPLPGGSRITVEPGGAVELSGPPLAGALPAIAAISADRAVLAEVFARSGLGLLPLGADPLRRPERVNPGARYRAMEAFFAASGTAREGAAMMTSTASVQVNVDAGPRDGWPQRVLLAHALGPVMIAIAANSPLLCGRFTGWLSSRQQVWGALDSARCGPVLGAAGDDPTTDWARYALNAPVMLVHDPDPEPVTEWVPFIDWVEGRVHLADRRPTTADLDYHLTTLFPPVRPRSWLEIRYLDALPDALWPAAVFTVVALLDHVPDAAFEAVESVATAWDAAARVGLGDHRLHAAARRCVELAAALAPPSLVESMTRLADAVEVGRCAADDFSDLVIRDGIDAAVMGSVVGSGQRG